MLARDYDKALLIAEVRHASAVRALSGKGFLLRTHMHSTPTFAGHVISLKYPHVKAL